MHHHSYIVLPAFIFKNTPPSLLPYIPKSTNLSFIIAHYMNKCIMAYEQCNENSITPSSTAKWWPESSNCSWAAGGANYTCNNPNSNCSNCDQEDVSISTSFTTNTSNNSGLSMESSRRLVEKNSTNDPYGEAVSDNHHLWNQVLLDVGTAGELENISSTRSFEPVCDYLKKMESGWEFSSTTNNINQQFHQKNFFSGFKDGMYQQQSSKIKPATVNNWSIAPPAEVEISPTFADQYMQLGQFTTLIKNEQNDHSDNTVQHDHQGLFRRGLSSTSHDAIDYPVGINEMVVGDNNKYYYNGVSDMECTNGRGFLDLVAFGGNLNKPSSESEILSNRSMSTNMTNLPDQRKSVIHNSYQAIRPRAGSMLPKVNGRGNGVANEGKRKKSSDDQSAGSLNVKKTKLDTSTAPSTKAQLPKAKLGDKITALQQIVSPFGKTDTASVLWEAIGYIKCLQEQVQLLSNPYMKTNIIKDSWVRFESKDREETQLDLKSRGLCLVPVSCTPQVCHETHGSDYWTPTYRGCFYR